MSLLGAVNVECSNQGKSRVIEKIWWPFPLEKVLFFFFFFFVNLVFRAKIEIYVTRSNRCVGLRTGRRFIRYCPKTCRDSGDWPPSMGLCARDTGFRATTLGRAQDAIHAYYPLLAPLLYLRGIA